MNQQNFPKGHLFDSDAVCVDCGFDGAEWSHWRNYTYEGRASTDVKKPLCTMGNRDTDQYIECDDWEDDHWNEQDNWGDE